MKRFYVFSCMDCNKPILVKVEFMRYNDASCLDFKNHKLLKVFNDEMEASNYVKRIANED